MMRPLRAFIIGLTTALLQLNAPLRFVAITLSHSSSFMAYEKVVPGDAGIVDEDIQTPPALERRLHEFANLARIGDIDAAGKALLTQCLDFVGHGCGCRSVAGTHCHGGAAGGKLERDLAPDAA